MEEPTCCPPSSVNLNEALIKQIDEDWENITSAERIRGIFLLTCDDVQKCPEYSYEFDFYMEVIKAYDLYVQRNEF